MKGKLSTTSILLLVVALVVVGVAGCARAAEEREPQATESADAQETSVAPGGEEATSMPGETVVSAVTLTPGTPGEGAQPTQPPEGGTAVAEATATTEPAATPAAPAAPPSEGTDTVVWHTVQQGETLSSIARRYGTSWQAIAQANGLVNPNQIYAGQKLKIPASTGSPGGTTGTTTGCRLRHTVKPGEWVWQIARNYGVSPYDILAANGLTVQNANVIYAGKVLCIP
jgi:LysM repeat protein